jgi:hypothetical protein
MRPCYLRTQPRANEPQNRTFCAPCYAELLTDRQRILGRELGGPVFPITLSDCGRSAASARVAAVLCGSAGPGGPGVGHPDEIFGSLWRPHGIAESGVILDGCLTVSWELALGRGRPRAGNPIGPDQGVETARNGGCQRRMNSRAADDGKWVPDPPALIARTSGCADGRWVGRGEGCGRRSSGRFPGPIGTFDPVGTPGSGARLLGPRRSEARL